MKEKGFSLIELMVAMVVTLIITGAVFQLVTAGHSAFRREPAMAERQQNIRMALDLITQDLYQAGYGVPDFAQVFTRALDGTGTMGSGGQNSDQLEMVRSAECAYLTVCDVQGTKVFTLDPLGSCFQLPTAIIAGCGTGGVGACPNYDVYWADTVAGAGTCGTGGLDLSAGKYSVLTAPGVARPAFTPQWILAGSIVRYRINPDADGVPNLERSPLGGANDSKGNSSWQIIARGVEDMQVEYENAAGWSNDPGTASDVNTLVRRVRVRLSARSMEQNVEGETTSPAGGDAMRGELGVAVAPRAAVGTLGIESGEL